MCCIYMYIYIEHMNMIIYTYSVSCLLFALHSVITIGDMLCVRHVSIDAYFTGQDGSL